MSHGPPKTKARAVGGLLSAAAALLALELILHHLNPTGTLPWDRGAEEYYTLVPELRAFGAAPVALVGSSRGREGFLPPVLKKALARGGIETRVANYSLAGAQAEEIGLAIARLLEARPTPELIVWGVSPRTLVPRSERPSPKARYLWRIEDWWTMRKTFGSDADKYLPQACRNEAARISWLVRYRPEVERIVFEERGNKLNHFSSLIYAERQPKSPMRGAVTPWKRGRAKNRSRRVSRARVREYIGDRYSDPSWPRNYQLVFFEDAVRRVAESSAGLLLVEVPVHPMLRKAIGGNKYSRFYDAVRAISHRFSVPFITTAERRRSYGSREFMEQSHLNYRGARNFTEGVAPYVARALASQNWK